MGPFLDGNVESMREHCSWAQELRIGFVPSALVGRPCMVAFDKGKGSPRCRGWLPVLP